MRSHDLTPEEHAERLGPDFRADERETSILIDHYTGVAHFETTEPFTAKRWCRHLLPVDGVEYVEGRASFCLTMPEEMTRRNPGLMVVLPRCRAAYDSGTGDLQESIPEVG